MDDQLLLQTLKEFWVHLDQWITAYVLVPGNLVQAALILLLFGVSGFFARPLKRAFEFLRLRFHLERLVQEGAPLSRPIAWGILQWLSVLVATGAGLGYYLLKISATLITAWVLIRFVVRLVKDKMLAHTLAWIAWILAALNILDLREPTARLLQQATLSVGSTTISLYQVIASTILLVAFLSIAMASGRVLERRILSSEISPTLQVLAAKSLIRPRTVTIPPSGTSQVVRPSGWCSTVIGFHSSAPAGRKSISIDATSRLRS